MGVTILTGPVRSGKTSLLGAWADSLPAVAGILSPDGPDGRVLVDLASRDTRPFETRDPAAPAIPVGRFRFLVAGFDWANARLACAATLPAPVPVIVDEIGPIELGGGGLRPGIAALLGRREPPLVLVVRAALVAEVRGALGLSYARVVTQDQWPQQAQTIIGVP